MALRAIITFYCKHNDTTIIIISSVCLWSDFKMVYIDFTKITPFVEVFFFTFCRGKKGWMRNEKVVRMLLFIIIIML